MPRSSSSFAAFSIASMSLFEPITMPTRGASTSMSSSCACTSASCIGSGASDSPGVSRSLIGQPRSSSERFSRRARGDVAPELHAVEGDHLGRSIRRAAGGAGSAPSAVTFSTRPPAVTTPAVGARGAGVRHLDDRLALARRSRVGIGEALAYLLQPAIGSPLEEDSG